jgi:dUTP pyrophosphatase
VVRNSAYHKGVPVIKFRCEDGQTPKYQTTHSAAADLMAAEALTIPAGGKAKVRTGVWIESVDFSGLKPGILPELQIRARSGLAFKHGITLTNAIGTIDADYRDEICVLLWNTGSEPFSILKGDRIAQMALNMVGRLDSLDAGGLRLGGFGSTGVSVSEVH